MLVLMALAYSFGALLGVATGFNPIVSGSVSLVASAVVQAPKGALFTGVDLSDVTTALGKYMSVPKVAQDIWSRLFQGLELAPYMKKIGNQTGKYVGVNSITSELMQPFQKGWTPKGTVDFNPYINDVFRAKVDFLLDNIDDVYASWLMFFADETKERKDWPLVRYIVEVELLPKIIEEMNFAMCGGAYVAPTAGTAGASLATMNGYKTQITSLITAGSLTPIVTGAISPTNALDSLETFADGIDSKYSDKGGVIFCSKSVERFYKQDYRATFGSTNSADAKNQLKLDNYNIRLVGLEGWGSSQRLMFSNNNGNMVHLYDKIFTPSTFQVQQDKRSVILMADWHQAVGFNTLTGVYVNDQL